MLYRDFTKFILAQKLHQELTDWSSKVDGIQSKPNGTDSFRVILNDELTAQEDIDLAGLVNAHIPSDSFLEQQSITDARMADGYSIYRRIFAHISDVEPVDSIDGFLAIYPLLITFRCLLKDGQNESALRFMAKEIEPLGAFSYVTLYKSWVRENAKKYNPALSDAILDAIETAPDGAV
jgi:hypothetical protein